MSDYTIYESDMRSECDGDHVRARCDYCGEVRPKIIDTELGKRACVCAPCLREWLEALTGESPKPHHPDCKWHPVNTASFREGTCGCPDSPRMAAGAQEQS